MTTRFLFSFSTLVLLLNISTSIAQEVEDEREFSYNISDPNGPMHWGNLHKEWRVCGNGKMQSPIDISDQRVKIFPALGKLNRNFRSGNATLVNRGHDMMLQWEENTGGYITINGLKYMLKQCHWHMLAEHTLNGHRYAAELHIVHEATNGKIAVISILYKFGHPDTFLSKLRPYLQKVAGSEEKRTAVGLVTARHIKFGSRKYYRYFGSLTTPPCTEGVIWTISHKVRTVSREQAKLLRVAVHEVSELGNARPLQELNSRSVQLYKPTKSERKDN